MKLFGNKIPDLLKFRILPKIILKHHPNLRKFVLPKCPNLRNYLPEKF